MLHSLPTPFSHDKKPFLVQLLLLAIPISLGIMVQTSYHLINAFWVSKIDAQAVAIVTVSFPIQLILITLASGLSLAASILIAQKHGAKNSSEISLIAGQTLSGLALLAVFLTAAMVILAPFIVTLLSSEQAIYKDSVNYFRYSALGTTFVYLNLAYQSILRGLGKVNAPLFIIIPSVLLNAILDPILIFGWGPIPEFGVQGAAYATIATQFLSALAGLWLMLLPRYRFKIGLAQLRFDQTRIKNLLRIGLPASIEQSMGAATVAVVTSLASQYGILTLASYGIVFRVISFCLIPGMGVSLAISILVGRNLGAGRTKSVYQMAIKTAVLNFAQMATFGGLVFYFSDSIAASFAQDNAELQNYVTLALQIIAVSLPFTSIQMAFNGAFRGAGDTLGAMLISLTSVWVYQIPLSFILSLYTPLEDLGLWWATTLSAILIGVTTWVYFKSDRWKRNFATS